jgi:hypothetical protein
MQKMRKICQKMSRNSKPKYHSRAERRIEEYFKQYHHIPKLILVNPFVYEKLLKEHLAAIKFNPFENGDGDNVFEDKINGVKIQVDYNMQEELHVI